MDRRITVAAVAVLILISGCSALTGSNTTATPDDGTPTADANTPAQTATQTPTVTATAAPTATDTTTPTETATESSTTETGQGTPTPAPDLEPVSSMEAPPGVDGRTLANDTALVQRHSESLSGETFRSELIVFNSSTENVTLAVRNGTDSILMSLDNPDDSQRTDYYYASDRSGVRNRTSGAIRVGTGPTGVAFEAGFATGALRHIGAQFATTTDWHAIGVRTTESGEKRLVFTPDRLNQSEAAALSLVSEGETLRSLDGRMEVGADGVIHSIDLTATVERSDGTVETRGVEYRVRDRGDVSVSAPAWLDEPPQMEASVTANDSLIVVDHTGGPAIEAGTNLSVGGGFGGGANATLDQRVAPGDTVYVYQTGEGFDTTQYATVNERPEVPEEATAYSGSVVVSGTQGLYTFEVGVQVESER